MPPKNENQIQVRRSPRDHKPTQSQSAQPKSESKPAFKRRNSKKRKTDSTPAEPGESGEAEGTEPKNKKQKTSTIPPTPTETDECTEIPDDEASFQLLEINDLTKHEAKDVHRVFLMDLSKVPEGGPSGIDDDALIPKNYPNTDPSELNKHRLPFLIRECTVKFLEQFKTLNEGFDEDKYIRDSGMYFAGPGGNGKSYVLYYIVQLCRALGWLVLYVPRG
ncbi:hypothetical protein BC937DRAFT_90866, partial [Endogone sp. FLAS-F59071]